MAGADLVLSTLPGLMAGIILSFALAEVRIMYLAG
jgi:hypothetical protein